MLIQTQVGIPATRQAGGVVPNVPGGAFGELLESRLLPDYYTLLKSGLVFCSALLGATALTAFTGGAAGTPVIGLFNPPNSGKDLVLLEAVVGIRTTGTTAGTVDFNHFGVSQGGVAVTGTNTAPRNLYSLGATGSVATAMQNAANTGALASSLLRPSISLGNVTTTAGLNVGLLRDEIKGEIVIAPGNYYALGASAALAVANVDAALIWAEIPV